MRRESARALGARELAAQRDHGLNEAALNVRDVLEQVAREHPDGSAPARAGNCMSVPGSLRTDGNRHDPRRPVLPYPFP
jgi:hypothetical protein